MNWVATIDMAESLKTYVNRKEKIRNVFDSMWWWPSPFNYFVSHNCFCSDMYARLQSADVSIITLARVFVFFSSLSFLGKLNWEIERIFTDCNLMPHCSSAPIFEQLKIKSYPLKIMCAEHYANYEIQYSFFCTTIALKCGLPLRWAEFYQFVKVLQNCAIWLNWSIFVWSIGSDGVNEKSVTAITRFKTWVNISSVELSMRH